MPSRGGDSLERATGTGSDVTETAMAAIFAGTHCGELVYSISTKKQDVRLGELSQAIGHDFSAQPRVNSSCASRLSGSDYHLHVSWRLRGDDFITRVEFVEGYMAPRPNEREPWAEQFMGWMSQFVSPGRYPAAAQADFSYLTSERESRFPLPMTVAIGPNGGEAEIDGIAFSVPTQPEGIWHIWLSRVADKLEVHLGAEREVDFAAFDPKKEILAFSGVLESVLEEKKS